MAGNDHGKAGPVREVRTLAGPGFGPVSEGRPDCLVVMLHGVGADGDDLIGLAPELAKALPKALFLAPDGPEPCDMAPMGRQWFSLLSREPGCLESGVRRAAGDLDAFLGDLLAREGLGPDRLILLGFSQGAMVALHAGLRGTFCPRAVIALSGTLLAAETLDRELLHRPPTLILHGDADPVVPVIAADHARDILGRAGLVPAVHILPGLGHGIDERALALIRRFLAPGLSGTPS